MAGVTVDIISDTVCPWCYVGKRNLDKAVQQTGTAVDITWRPFLLVPTQQWRSDWGDEAMSKGVDKVAFYDKRFGKGVWKEFTPRVEAALRNAGVDGFSMEGRTGPSFDSHRLLTWAHAVHGGPKQHELAEHLFEAYFVRGNPLCDKAVLLAAAQKAGLPTDEVQAVLADATAYEAETRAELEMGARRGVRGVPHFVIKGPKGEETVSGGQPADVLAASIRRVM